MKLLYGFAAIAAFATGAAEAAERLSADGSRLAARALQAGENFEVAVDTAGDEVLAVHTLLRPASTNVVLMRDRDGFWTEWSGRRDDLIPSAARANGDTLTYKVFQSPPPGVTSMTITLIYRTETGWKHGILDAGVAAKESN
ncbi:MAG: hypothetical protein AAF401_06435 [Pseudomonadota bacterium]